MKESQIIDWLIQMAENNAKLKTLNPTQKKIFDSRLKIMAEIKQKLKRIDYFGGIETLIAKASIQGQKETLFPEINSDNSNS